MKRGRGCCKKAFSDLAPHGTLVQEGENSAGSETTSQRAVFGGRLQNQIRETKKSRRGRKDCGLFEGGKEGLSYHSHRRGPFLFIACWGGRLKEKKRNQGPLPVKSYEAPLRSPENALPWGEGEAHLGGKKPQRLLKVKCALRETNPVSSGEQFALKKPPVLHRRRGRKTRGGARLDPRVRLQRKLERD